MGLESKFWNKLGFILILAHFPATWELKIWKFSNFGQNHFSDFETPFLTCLISPAFNQTIMLNETPYILLVGSSSIAVLVGFPSMVGQNIVWLWQLVVHSDINQ